jgi:hypothetical protein
VTAAKRPLREAMMSSSAGDSFVAETRDLQPYDPEEANRQLRSMLQDTMQEARQGGKWLVRSQLAVAAATILMMVFNGVTAWLTYKQIDAVRTSTELARQQFNLSQRPWVAATDLRIVDIEIGKMPRAVMRIANKGLTPAKIRTRLYLFVDRKLPTEFQYPDVPHTSTVILLPDSPQSVSIYYPAKITEQVLSQIDSGELLLYAYGFAEYEDIRGNTYPPTRFCVFWDPMNKTSSYCDTHNTVQ